MKVAYIVVIAVVLSAISNDVIASIQIDSTTQKWYRNVKIDAEGTGHLDVDTGPVFISSAGSATYNLGGVVANITTSLATGFDANATHWSIDAWATVEGEKNGITFGGETIDIETDLLYRVKFYVYGNYSLKLSGYLNFEAILENVDAPRLSRSGLVLLEDLSQQRTAYNASPSVNYPPAQQGVGVNYNDSIDYGVYELFVQVKPDFGGHDVKEFGIFSGSYRVSAHASLTLQFTNLAAPPVPEPRSAVILAIAALVGPSRRRARSQPPPSLRG